MIIAIIKKKGKNLYIDLSPHNVKINQKDREFKLTAYHKENKRKREVGDLEFTLMLKKDGFPKEINVNNIDVIKPLQKQGFGKIIMGFCQCIAQASNLRITLFSLGDVIGFHKKCGFHSACKGSQDMVWTPKRNRNGKRRKHL